MSAHGVVEINIAAAASIFDMGGTVNGVAVWPAPLGSSGSARPRRPWSSSWLATTALGARAGRSSLTRWRRRFAAPSMNLKNTAQPRFERRGHVDAASFERPLYHLGRPPHMVGARVRGLERRQQRHGQSAVGRQGQILLDALIIAAREGSQNLFARIRPAASERSEERRGGKECRSRWSP